MPAPAGAGTSMISGPIAPGKSSRSSTRSGFTDVVSGTAKSMDWP